MSDSKIRTLIVDDEPLAREKIRRLLEKMPDLVVAGECSNGLQAVETILSDKPDLVFLDIQMPGLDGFGVIRTIGVENMPMIIFVTAFDQYAIRAFESHAFDYLLKPFDSKRFVSAVERVVSLIRRQPADDIGRRLDQLMQQLKGKDNYIERILIKSTSRVYFVKVDEIDWVEAAGNYVDIHVGAETHLLRETMNNLETKLDPARFLRIHRSTLVNIDRIREMQPDSNNDYTVILKSGECLLMSRRQREKLNKVIGPYL